MRTALRIVVALGLSAIVARTWLVDELLQPMVIAGASMAPALLGEHRRVPCGDCGYELICDEESLPENEQAVCPNCGATNDLAGASCQRGDRLIIDRRAYSVSRPQRWDVAVFPLPGESAEWAVKRIAGLPGETLEIQGGDVYADGRLIRKSLEELAEVAVKVHDSKYSAPTGHGRWHALSPDSAWQKISFGDENRGTTGTQIDWLEYVHEQVLVPGGARRGPILDDLVNNQNESRELTPVGDMMLRCNLKTEGSGELWLRARDGRKQFEVRIDLDRGTGAVFCGGEPSEEFHVDQQIGSSDQEIVLALADAQLQLAWGERLIFRYLYDPTNIVSRPSERPLAIGSRGAAVRLSRLEVLRDLYYLPAAGPVAPCELGEGEYFVLGDNSALSEDSRSWRENRVRGSSILGKVVGIR